MSELVSSVELRKADGKPIKFNFQFENGLPVKPILSVVSAIGETEKSKELVIILYIQDNTEKIDFNINNISTFRKDNLDHDLWIHFENNYAVINIEDKYLKRLEKENSYFQIYDKNSILLKSLYNKIC